MNRAKSGNIFYIDLLRFVAATAVVIIHVLGPLRQLYGQIPTMEWLAPASYNAATRWAVPVFMMISGALLLSSRKEFQAGLYLSKRLSKVAVPFIGWTIIYAVVTGMLGSGWNDFLQALQASPNEPTWYHMWFFYDFIPLYFVIPFLAPVLRRLDGELAKMLLFAYATLFTMKWIGVHSFLMQNLILYTGYLVLGWYLFNRDNRESVRIWVMAGIGMLLLNIVGTYLLALETGKYSSFFMGYKTLNTAVIGGMIFVLAQRYADRVRGKVRAFISKVARYSLGIYLIHPLFLIPVRDLDNGYYDIFGSYWISIPIITIAVIFISLYATIALSRLPLTRRLVP